MSAREPHEDSEARQIVRLRPDDTIRPLLLEYLSAHFEDLRSTFGVTLSLESEVASDMASIGQFAAPKGALFVAKQQDRLLGCVGLRTVSPAPHKVMEIKRLYVRPEGRGFGLGRRLVMAVLDAAREMGATTVRLDTYATMTEAQGLYRSLGFEVTAPFEDSDVPETFRSHWIYLTRDA